MLWPPRRTSAGVTPAPASPSAAQPVCSWVEEELGEPPKPPSAFCARSRYDTARALALAASEVGGDAAAPASAASASRLAAAAAQRSSKRRRKRVSERTKVGPRRRQNM